MGALGRAHEQDPRSVALPWLWPVEDLDAAVVSGYQQDPIDEAARYHAALVELAGDYGCIVRLSPDPSEPPSRETCRARCPDRPAEWCYACAAELYPAGEGCVIGQQLFDGGLIFLVNQSVLHHYGFALGVSVDDGRVTGLSLHRTSDEDGIYFDEADVVKGRRRMRAAEYLPPRETS